jgi:hypothetical protein
VSIDPEVLAAELTADDDVLASLKSNGDVCTVGRKVDVSFRGEIEGLEALAEACARDGFAVIDRTRTDDDVPWVFFERHQTTERTAIHDLTRYCLEKSQQFGVAYDGWGCVAWNERGPISNENPA